MKDGALQEGEPARWNTTSDAFMSDTYEPTARIVNGLSSSIWTSLNSISVFLVRENDLYSDRPDNHSFIFSFQHLLHVLFFFVSLFFPDDIVYCQNVN